MLWYKAWRESRLRFVVSAMTLAAACVLIVAHGRSELAQAQGSVMYLQYVWVWTYRGGVKNLFLLLTPLLGLGGLLKEKAYGTVTFTLGLPVTRLQLVLDQGRDGISRDVHLGLTSPTDTPHFKLATWRFQRWVRSGVMTRMMTALANELAARGGIDVREAFIDASFALAKKGAQGRENKARQGNRDHDSRRPPRAASFGLRRTCHAARGDAGHLHFASDAGSTSLCGPVFLRSVSRCWRIYPIERHDLTKPHLGHFSVPTAIATGNFLAFEHFPGLDL